MKIIKKLIAAGNSSRAVVLPKSWLMFYERATGEKIDEVIIDVNGSIVIKPMLREVSRGS